MDIVNYNSLHICANFVFSIRNSNDYSCFIGQEEKSLNYFSKDKNIWGFKHFIKISELLSKNKHSNNKAIIENDKLTVGVFIRLYKYKIEQYIDESKFFLKYDTVNKTEIKDKCHFQWKIKDCINLDDINYSPEFIVGGYKWRIKLCLNENEYLSIYLIFEDEIKEDSPPLFFNYVLAIRNYNNSSCFVPYVSFYNKIYDDRLEYGNPKFIKISDLSIKNMINNKALIENNKIIISAYVWLYENEKLDCYINNLKGLINNANDNEEDIIEEGYYEWLIKDWDDLENIVYSPEFMIGEYKWKIKLYPNGNDKVKERDYVSLFLENLDTIYNNFSNTFAKFVLSFRNINDYSGFTEHSIPSLFHFNKTNNSLGFRHFIKKSDLYEKNEKSGRPLIEDGKIIVGVYINIYQSRLDEEALKIKKHPYTLLPKLMNNNSIVSLDNRRSSSSLIGNDSSSSFKSEPNLFIKTSSFIFKNEFNVLTKNSSISSIRNEVSSPLSKNDSDSSVGNQSTNTIKDDFLLSL
jgi:hypothetical protein